MNQPVGPQLPWSPTRIDQVLSGPTGGMALRWIYHSSTGQKTAPDGRFLGEFGTPRSHGFLVLNEEGMRYESIWGYRRIFLTRGSDCQMRGVLHFFGYLQTETHTNWRTALRLSKRSLALQLVVKMLLQPETCWNKCCHHGTYSVWISLLLTSSICLSVIAWFGIKRGSQVDTNITPSINVHYSHCSKDPSLTKQKQHIGTFTYNHEIIYFAEYNLADWIWLVVSSHPNDMLVIRGHHISLS